MPGINLFMRNHLEKYHHNRIKNNVFHIIRNWKCPSTHYFDPFYSKAVKHRVNPLIMRNPMQITHQNWIKNKNFTSPAKSHFYNLLTPYIHKIFILGIIVFKFQMDPNNRTKVIEWKYNSLLTPTPTLLRRQQHVHNIIWP